MSFSDLIKSIATELDPNNVRINAFPDIVWLFGGPISTDTGKEFCSLRNVFLSRLHDTKHALTKLVRTPEEYPEWNTFDGYQDLLEFERDAGYLAKATVIFCESPGAYAELGTFAADLHLSNRTIVVLQRDFSSKNSYITLGPTQHIENIDEKATCIIEAKSPKDFYAEVDLVINAVETKINKAHKTEAYTPNSVRDQFLLIADFVDLFQAITTDELLLILPKFGLDISIKRLRQLLRQLILFKIITKEQVGIHKYLVASPSGQQYVNHQAIAGLPPFDRTRFKATTFSALQKDVNRLRAFQLSRRGNP